MDWKWGDLGPNIESYCSGSAMQKMKIFRNEFLNRIEKKFLELVYERVRTGSRINAAGVHKTSYRPELHLHGVGFQMWGCLRLGIFVHFAVFRASE